MSVHVLVPARLMEIMLHIILLLFVLKTAVSQQSSPCPSTFSYEPRGEEDTWYGVVSLRTVEDLTGVWINVILDKPATSLGTFFGEVTTTDNREYIITNTKYKLEAGPAVTVRFFIKYDPENKSAPNVKTIRLNGKTICSTKVHESSLRPTMPTLHISKPKSTMSPEYNVQSLSHEYTTEKRRTINRQHGESNSGATEMDNDNKHTTRRYNSNDNEFPSNERTTDRYNSQENQFSSGRRTTEKYHSNDNVYSSYRRTTEGYNSNGKYSDNRRTTERYNSNNEYSPNKKPSEEYDSHENRYPSTRDERTTERYNHKTTRRSSTRPTSSWGQNSGEVHRRPDSNALEIPDDSEGDFFAGDFGSYRPAHNQPSPRPTQHSDKSYSCGTVASRATPLISNGQNTTPGQWPWHVALYHSKGLQLVYTCGGTLISEQHVITAAHCVAKPRSTKTIDPKNLLIYLGKYDLITFGPDVQDRDVSDIFIHPEYNHTNFFNDIAVLKMSTTAIITSYVRPCCLWLEDTNTESIIDKEGTVVGWGFDQNKKLSNKLMQAQMPVVSTVTCIYSNREFFSQFTFDKNFCAGFRNGTSVCNGDSGGGMVFPKRGTSDQGTAWQLRGVVSVGVALQGTGTCDASHYVVFTDVAKYTDWIRQVLAE